MILGRSKWVLQLGMGKQVKKKMPPASTSTLLNFLLFHIKAK